MIGKLLLQVALAAYRASSRYGGWLQIERPDLILHCSPTLFSLGVSHLDKMAQTVTALGYVHELLYYDLSAIVGSLITSNNEWWSGRQCD
jgi:hypothetical protein